MAKLKCSDCGDNLYRFKITVLAVCYHCQRDKNNMRKRLKLNGMKGEQLKNWVCNCNIGELGYVKSPEEYCCFTCLAINPNFKSYEIRTKDKI